MYLLSFLLIFVFGSIVGSFISALTYRNPRNKSIVKGRSMCPNCKHQINWYDNIPIISFFFLSGKCRYCKKTISKRYPVIEASTGLLFTLGFYELLSCLTSQGKYLLCGFGTDGIWAMIFLFTITTIFISIFVVDLEHMIIPDGFTFVGLFLASVYLSIFLPEHLIVNFLSGLVSASFLLFLNLVTLGRGMGLGDVKLAILGGLVLGPVGTLVWMFTSFILGAIIGGSLVLIGKAHFKRQIPFGPFMVVGFFISLYWSDKLFGLTNIGYLL